jgi:hypothetical protein
MPVCEQLPRERTTMPAAPKTYDSILKQLDKTLGAVKGELEQLSPGPQREELLRWCRDSRFAVLRVRWAQGVLEATPLRGN